MADVFHAAAREGGGQACSLKGVFWAPSGFNIHTMIEKYRENLYKFCIQLKTCSWENLFLCPRCPRICLSRIGLISHLRASRIRDHRIRDHRMRVYVQLLEYIRHDGTMPALCHCAGYHCHYAAVTMLDPPTIAYI